MPEDGNLLPLLQINLQLRISIGDGPVCQFASGSPSVSLGLRIEVFTQKNDGSVCAVVVLKDVSDDGGRGAWVGLGALGACSLCGAELI